MRKHGCVVDVALDGQTALDKVELTPYDVVVLDRDLPVVHGDTVCRQLAHRGTSRILMLTASGAVEDRVDGLTLGGDDYLGKPFAFTELVARVRALARRVAPARPPVLRAAALAVVAALAATLGWLVAGRVLRPIRTVSAIAQRLSAENLASRVPVPAPPDELATLAETINSMLDRIQSGIADRDRLLASQRMFVANAAHELRTR